MAGRLESFYFALGQTDALLVVDAPDVVAAVALGLAVNATGAVRSTMTPLLISGARRQSHSFVGTLARPHNLGRMSRARATSF